MTIAWREGVRALPLRQGYTREPEDVVARQAVDSGPPLRRLTDAVRKETVRGVIRLPASQYELFQAWYAEDIEFGAAPFDWIVPDSGRACAAKFVSAPQSSAGAGGSFLVNVEICCEPDGPPSQELLAALAAIDGPVEWPDGLKAAVRRRGFSTAFDDAVLRSDRKRAREVRRLPTRAVGRTIQAVWRFSDAEKADFEAFFVSDLGMGCADFMLPWQGGAILASFAGGYRVTPGEGDFWAVAAPVYFEP